jgi:hypothetical protein
VPLIAGASIKQAFQQASSVPFSLIVNDELADNEEGVDLSAEDFVDKLWLLSITLLLIMISGEELVERGRLEKTRKPNSDNGRPTEFWSPNFLGRLYQSAIASEAGNHRPSTQRLHWRRGHIKSQPDGLPLIEKDHLDPAIPCRARLADSIHRMTNGAASNFSSPSRPTRLILYHSSPTTLKTLLQKSATLIEKFLPVCICPPLTFTPGAT